MAVEYEWSAQSWHKVHRPLKRERESLQPPMSSTHLSVIGLVYFLFVSSPQSIYLEYIYS